MTATTNPWKPFAKRYPSYGVKGYKTWEGMDGHGYSFTITKDGANVCVVLQDGRGGETALDWTSPEAEEAMRALVEARRAEIPPDREVDGFKDRAIFNLEIMIEEMGCESEEERKLRRTMKSKTVFTVAGDEWETEGFRMLPYIFTPIVAAMLRARYGDTVTILNVVLA